MVTLKTVIKQLAGLVDTTHLNTWENFFVSDIIEKTQEGEISATLNDNQVKVIREIYDKHFA